MTRCTLLTPLEQWNRTTELLPWRARGGHHLDPFFVLRNNSRTLSFWDRVHDLYDTVEGQPGLGRRAVGVFLGRIRRNTRLFLKGDLVLVSINNGGAERFPVTAVSSRGYTVKDKWLKVRHWNTGPLPKHGGHEPASKRSRPSGPLEVLDCPDELVGLRPADPGVRAWVLERLSLVSRS